MKRCTCACLGVLALIGCPGPPPTGGDSGVVQCSPANNYCVDGGLGVDGSIPADASVGPDSGIASDAGTSSDAGTPRDAGIPPDAGVACAASTTGNCVLNASNSGGTSGACATGYTGSCSFSCSNGAWTQV